MDPRATMAVLTDKEGKQIMAQIIDSLVSEAYEVQAATAQRVKFEMKYLQTFKADCLSPVDEMVRMVIFCTTYSKRVSNGA